MIKSFVVFFNRVDNFIKIFTHYTWFISIIEPMMVKKINKSCMVHHTCPPVGVDSGSPLANGNME
jgi:hypothetical protein